MIADLSSVLLDNPFFGPAGFDPLPSYLDQEIEGIFRIQNDNQFVAVPIDKCPWHLMNSNQRCIIELWLTVIEGLTGAVVVCPRALQSEVLDALSQITHSLRRSPG